MNRSYNQPQHCISDISYTDQSDKWDELMRFESVEYRWKLKVSLLYDFCFTANADNVKNIQKKDKF